MYTEYIVERIDKLVTSITNTFDGPVRAEQLGLDPRAGYSCKLYVLNDGVVASGDPRNLEYYGGFEYVDREYVTKIGDLTIYSDECDRVQDCIRFHYEESNNVSN